MRWLIILAVFALGACAPRIQELGPAALTGFIEPHLDGDRFVARDGQCLGFQTWEAEEPQAIILAFHGMNDYANAFDLPGRHWSQTGITTFAIDQRGHGRSPHRGIWAGWRVMEQDVVDVVHVVRRQYPDLPIYLLGHSMGGGVVINAAAHHDLDVDGIILVAPAVWGWSTLQFPLDLSLWLTAHIAPGMIVTGESLNRWPTDNIELLREMSRDELMVFETRIDAVYGLVTLMERAYQDAAQISEPVLILYGARDEIVPPRPVADVIARMCPHRRVGIYENGFHLLMRDLQAEIVWSDVSSFIEDQERPLPSGAEAMAAAAHSC